MSGYAELNVGKTIKKCTQLATTASEVYRDAISSDQINIFHFRYYETQLFDIFHRKSSAVSLCKSIESAIQ